MTISSEEPASYDAGSSEEPVGSKSATVKLRKVLPAARVSMQNQREILRAVAIASTHDLKPVGNNEVGDIQGMHPNSISMCNPFFYDVGFLIKQGHKYIPCKEVLDYADKAQWDPEAAGHKLAPVIQKTWFAGALLPRMQLKPLKESDAIAALAEISGASPQYKAQLVMLIDYMEFSGLVVRNSGLLEKPKGDNVIPLPAKDPEQSPLPINNAPPPPEPVVSQMEVFRIPIPGKDSATITIPKDLSPDDWIMVKAMLEAYISRLQSQYKSKESTS